MTDIERRALMGDRQAQEECTRRGIALACPFCRGGEIITINGKAVIHMSKSCPISGFIFRMSDWNTRPAPPVGRCVECGRKTLRGNRIFCEVNGIMSEDDFCNYLKPKGGKENG